MPVFTNSPASLRVRRAVRLTTLPLNTNVDVASPNPASPTSPGLMPDNESLVLKAKRAYDRDRHHAKRRKERSDRERNASITNLPASADCRHCREGSGRHPGGGRSGAKTRLEMKEPEGEKDAFPTSPQVEEIIADVVERTAQVKGESLAAGQPLEVHIERLMKPGKARKSKAGEFELVPGMPVVIALDDQIPDEAELDEPWEHISADELDEKRVKPPSYATVLANAS